MLLNFALVLLCCLLLTLAQMLCKLGVNQANLASSTGPRSEIFRALVAPYTLAGLGTYGVVTLLWLYVLARFDFSYVYPLMSLTFVFALLGSRWILEEEIPTGRWLGVVLIVMGVILSARE